MHAAEGGSSAGFAGTASGGARHQTAEIIKTFGEKCPEVLVNNIQTKADYVVVLDHEGGKGLLRHKNKVAVFGRLNGDAVVSKSTLSLGGSVETACEAIVKDWAAHGTEIRAAALAVENKSAASKAAAVPTSAQVVNSAVVSVPDGADIEWTAISLVTHRLISMFLMVNTTSQFKKADSSCGKGRSKLGPVAVCILKRS